MVNPCVRLWVLGVLFALFVSSAFAQDNGWNQYKQRFLQSDGRIIDTGNHNISHSEGQGVTMLLAVLNDDQQTFDRLWRWTRQTLYREDIGLFSWRYDPRAQVKISDRNNASDGDTFIAWALLKAGQKWQRPEYLSESKKIQNALLQQVTLDYAGYKVLLPGVAGFKKHGSVTLNPSYFMLPAWRDFYQSSQHSVWQALSHDALRMLQKMQFGSQQLPTDWVTLRSDGTFLPADGWPARFSYDAVRIPLYVHWYDANNAVLTPIRQFWRGFPRLNTPAWVNVLNANQAHYPLSPGMLAIQDVVLGNKAALSTALNTPEDYYSSSLRLLTWWSTQ